MNSYDYNDVLHNKISSLEKKVNRLEGIIRYGSQDEYYSTKSPSHYKSAVHLSNATRNLKQDLLRNPHHNQLDRDDYKQIYDRVSFLEQGLNNILNYMESTDRERSSYSYTADMESSSIYYDGEPTTQPRGYNTRRRIIQKGPQRKRVSYDRYVEVIPSDTTSSEEIEEIIYYIDSPISSSSSSTSVIVEEYVPKHYTRRTIRRAPIIDVSKSRPKRNIKKSEYKTEKRHKRRSPSERAEVKHPKVKKSRKGKKTLKVEGTESASEMRDEGSDIYLVKRTKESPKKDRKQDEKEKYYVSRLTKVDSSDDREKSEEQFHKKSAKGKSQRDKTNSSKWNAKPKRRNSEHKEIKQREKSYESQTNKEKLKKNNKRRVKERSQKVEQPKESIVVARSSFILNDPFVSTIYYDNFVSSEEGNKTSLSSNDKIVNNKSESGAESFPQTNAYNASKYEISNSFYSFDPVFKQKEKFYRTYKLNKSKSDENDNSGEHSTIFYNVDKNGVIVLNNNNLKPNQNKRMFKQVNKTRDIDKNILYRPKEKEKNAKTGEKLSSSYDVKCSSKTAFSNKPVAHSVYLTTVPIYQPTGVLDFLLPSYPPEIVTKQGESNSTLKGPKITSRHRTILEDEIVMNVAKKLSPVVAKMITSNLSRSKEESKTKVLSQTENSNNLSNSDVYLHDKSDTRSNVFNGHSEQCKPVKGKKSKEKAEKYISENTVGRNRIFIEVNSPNEEINKPFTESHVGLYYAAVENNSPLQQNPNTKKSALKKFHSITSVKSLFRKRKGKNKKSMAGKPSENFIQDIQSAQNTNTYPQNRDSQINRQEKAPRQQRESASEEEEEQFTVPLQGVLSFDTETQPNKSIFHNGANKMNRKKSSSRIKSILGLGRITSREKVSKNTSKQEPAPKSLLSRMKSGNKRSKSLKKKQSQDVHKQSQVHTWRYSEEEPVLSDRVKSGDRSSKVLKQEQNQKPRNEPYEENEGDSVYTGSQEYLKELKSTLLEDSNLGKVTDQAKGLQPEEIIREETSKMNRLNREDNNNYPRKNCPAKCPLQHVCEEPTTAQEVPEERKICPAEYPLGHVCEDAGTAQEVQNKPKKPFQFCIHFSKEKRSKFESQSTSSLDNILLSQCKKIYSTEELSLSEYEFDKNKGLYKTRKIHPKKQKDYFKLNRNCAFPCGQNSVKYHDSFMKDLHSMSISGCCCKNFRDNGSELVSDSSYSLDWHKVANELKQTM